MYVCMYVCMYVWGTTNYGDKLFHKHNINNTFENNTALQAYRLPPARPPARTHADPTQPSNKPTTLHGYRHAISCK